MAKLVLSLNGSVLNQFFTDQPTLSVGRAADNDISISDPQLGEYHARVLCVGADHILESLDSERGISINGKLCFRQILQHRDVILLGTHHLRYLNTRIASEQSLDRTMLIQALPTEAPAKGEIAPLPTARAAKISFPEAYVHVRQGAGGHITGENVLLDRVVTTFGIPGEALAVLTLRPNCIQISHVNGPQPPRINQKPIGRETQALAEGDLIEVAGYRLEFHLGSPPALAKPLPGKR